MYKHRRPWFRPGRFSQCPLDRFMSIVALLLLSTQSVQSLCPSRCRCDDSNLSAECTQSGLDVLPITLNPQLSSLQLRGNHIRSIQQTLSFYTNLQLLDLSANHLQSLGQRNLAQLQRLQQLNLDQNRIHRLETHSFEGLARLRLLTLSSNQLGELPARAFASLAQMQRLDVSHNHIVALKSDWAFGLRSLLHLNLSSNQLPADVFSQNWTHLTSLLELDLSHNPLHFLPSEAFAPLSQLRSLHLQNCLLQQIHSTSFRSLHSLLHLILSHNPLSTFPTVSLRSLSQLRSLRAVSLKLRSLSRSDFQTLGSLNSLYLGDEPLLTQLDSELFQNNNELQVLSIENCPRLNHIPSDLFSNRSQLHELRLQHNALRQFRQLQPIPLALRSILLTGNPLHCDCDLFWLTQKNLLPHSSIPLESPENVQPSIDDSHTGSLPQVFTSNHLPPPTSDISVDSLQAAIDEDEWTNQINPEFDSNSDTIHRRSHSSSHSSSFSPPSTSSGHLLNPFSPSAVEKQNHIDRISYSKHHHTQKNAASVPNAHLLPSASYIPLPSSQVADLIDMPQSNPSHSFDTDSDQPKCASPSLLQGHSLHSLSQSQLHCPPSSQFDFTAQTKFTSIEPVESDSSFDLWARLSTLPLSAFFLCAIVLICAIALVSIFWRLGSETVGCCRWWLLHLCHSKRRSSNVLSHAHLHRPSVLRSYSTNDHQRNSIASSGGGSMKPLCVPLHESKCLFDAPKNPPRYSKLRLLPLSSVPAAPPPPPLPPTSSTPQLPQQSMHRLGYESSVDPYASENHEYEQVRFYESIGPGSTLFTTSTASRLYENPMQRYESIPRRSTNTLRPSVAPYGSGVQLV